MSHAAASVARRAVTPIRPAVAALATVTLLVAACGGPASTSLATISSTPVAPSTLPTDSPAAPAASTSAIHAAPAARSAASMAWDPAREVVLLFGGDTERGPTNALHAWDGVAWTQLVADHATGAPPPRDDALLVADRERGVVVLFGGRTRERVFTDTWEWDGTAWHEIEVDGPPARVHAAAAYDASSKRVIVYGGVADEDVALSDTWAWDGSTWDQLEDGGIPGRIPNGMAWDPTLEQVVTLAVDLSANDGSGLYPSEVWGWTGSAWTRLGDGPPGFSPLQSFVDGPDHPVFVDGGVLPGALTALRWTGDAWSPIGGAGPSPRNGQSVAFDAARDELVLFGGFRGQQTFGDTWRIVSGQWQELAP